MTNLERMKAAAANKPAPVAPKPAAKSGKLGKPAAAQPPPPAKPKFKESKTPFEFKRGRLPDGARFDVTYNAAKQEWTGLLYLPPATEGENGKVFEASKSAVFKLLATLDDLYRAWLAEKKKAVDANPTPAVP